ncbi:MAG: hypothetical protein KDK51_02335 [Deltaproteobacteria bacterium]|nr:hypothetical protein [Deltaproteobacteria bacterium]
MFKLLSWVLTVFCCLGVFLPSGWAQSDPVWSEEAKAQLALAGSAAKQLLSREDDWIIGSNGYDPVDMDRALGLSLSTNENGYSDFQTLYPYNGLNLSKKMGKIVEGDELEADEDDWYLKRAVIESRVPDQKCVVRFAYDRPSIQGTFFNAKGEQVPVSGIPAYKNSNYIYEVSMHQGTRGIYIVIEQQNVGSDGVAQPNMQEVEGQMIKFNPEKVLYGYSWQLDDQEGMRSHVGYLSSLYKKVIHTIRNDRQDLAKYNFTCK